MIEEQDFYDKLKIQMVSVLVILLIIVAISGFLSSYTTFQESEQYILYPFIGDLLTLAIGLMTFVFVLFIVVFIWTSINASAKDILSVEPDTKTTDREFREASRQQFARDRAAVAKEGAARRERASKFETVAEAERAETEREENIEKRERAQEKLDKVNEELYTRRELGMDDDGDIFISDEKRKLDREKASLEMTIADLDRKIGDKK